MGILFLVSGFVLLILAGNYLVKSSVWIASKWHVSPLVIGVTIVSVGTSMPELVVSINAALGNHPDVALGNAIGSNIANIALIIGVTAVIFPIPVKRDSIFFDWPAMMLITLVAGAFMLNGYLGRVEGTVLLLLLLGYLYLTMRRSRKRLSKEVISTPNIPVFLMFALFLVSLGGLVFGARLFINGTVSVASALGVSERIISLTVVAIGTSFPELITSVVAAWQKQTDIAIGNVIGSNIFNLAGILGTTAEIKEIPVNKDISMFDLPWMVSLSIVLFLFMYFYKDRLISRIEGAFFLVMYCLYIYLLIGA